MPTTDSTTHPTGLEDQTVNFTCTTPLTLTGQEQTPAQGSDRSPGGQVYRSPWETGHAHREPRHHPETSQQGTNSAWQQTADPACHLQESCAPHGGGGGVWQPELLRFTAPPHDATPTLKLPDPSDAGPCAG
ncbi:hypothetical protein ACOMHN_046136 [Nucella lapillus]